MLRTLSLLFIFHTLFNLAAEAQELEGKWKGHIATPEKNLPYELIIVYTGNGYKAYSHITFFAKNDTVRILKNVAIQQEGNMLHLRDEEIIEDDLTEALPRKIKQLSTLTISNDYLVGKYKTEVPRNMRSSSGSIELKKEAPESESFLSSRLKKLNILDELPSIHTALHKEKEAGIIKTAANTVATPTAAPQANNIAVQLPEIESLEPMKRWTEMPNSKQYAVIKPPAIAIKKPSLKSVAKASGIIPDIVSSIARTTNPAPPAPIKTESKLPAATALPQKNNAILQPALAVLPKADLVNRKIETIESFEVNTDSLVLTLYDNGEVDGDTVSVLINGSIIINKQGLSTQAATKTIYLTNEMGSEIQLVMFAENLGAIAPNTGLLIIQDGPVRREVRFSGDLQKNAAIILRRRL